MEVLNKTTRVVISLKEKDCISQLKKEWKSDLVAS